MEGNESANGHRVCLSFWNGVLYFDSPQEISISLSLVFAFILSIYRSTATWCCVSSFIMVLNTFFYFFYWSNFCASFRPIAWNIGVINLWRVQYNCVICVHAMTGTESVSLCSYGTRSLIIHILSKREHLGGSRIVYAMTLVLYVFIYHDVWNVTIYTLWVALWPRTSSCHNCCCA